ncbi:MAG: hypothetical protein GXP45_06075 [bacterium]|nr:hypothetical protein [bacterium]
MNSYFLPLEGENLVKSFSNIKKKHHRLLCIIDQFNLASFPKDFWQDFNGTIINLYTGISSFAHKFSPELQDVALMKDNGFSVFEAYDL